VSGGIEGLVHLFQVLLELSDLGLRGFERRAEGVDLAPGLEQIVLQLAVRGGWGHVRRGDLRPGWRGTAAAVTDEISGCQQRQGEGDAADEPAGRSAYATGGRRRLDA
jgi:hypothetical protein